MLPGPRRTAEEQRRARSFETWPLRSCPGETTFVCKTTAKALARGKSVAATLFPSARSGGHRQIRRDPPRAEVMLVVRGHRNVHIPFSVLFVRSHAHDVAMQRDQQDHHRLDVAGAIRGGDTE